MKSFKIAAIAVASIFATQLSATTLTFDVLPATTNRANPGNYGDRVTATNADVDGSGISAAGTYLVGSEGATGNVVVDFLAPDNQLWTTGYNDLVNVYFGEPDGSVLMGLKFTADSGFDVTLDAFDIGNFGGAVVLNAIDILVDGLSVFSQANVALNASSGAHLSFDNLGLSGSMIELRVDTSGLGGASDNIGLDNVLFSQSRSDPPPPIPLPGGLPLIAGALGLLGIVRRMRR